METKPSATSSGHQPWLSSKDQLVLDAVVAALRHADAGPDRAAAPIRALVRALGAPSAGRDAAACPGAIQRRVDTAPSLEELAAEACEQTVAMEVYLVSALVLDANTERGRAYLHDMAGRLRLTPAMVSALNERVRSERARSVLPGDRPAPADRPWIH